MCPTKIHPKTKGNHLKILITPLPTPHIRHAGICYKLWKYSNYIIQKVVVVIILFRSVKILLVVSFFTIFLFGCSSGKALDLLGDADKEFKKGNYDVSKEIYKNVLSNYSAYDEAILAREALASFDTKVAFEKKLKAEEEEKRQLELSRREIVYEITGDGYKTFFVYVRSNDDKFLIDISKEFKEKYKDLRLGFQVRFVNDKKARTNKEGFAVYAYTKHLNVSCLTKYDSNSEYVVLDNL